ncbi:MAG: EAL domain-containing protein [Cyanobacteria bacterium J06614_10]
MKSGINALLIQDNFSEAQLFKAVVSFSERTPLTLHHITHFNDAIAQLTTSPFDIVFLDLGLPSNNGIDLIRQLRTLAPQVPIVAMNHSPDTALAAAALKAGAQDYLVKPDVFSPERLKKLGYADIGNLLVTTMQHAIQRAELIRQLTVSQERYELAVQGSNDGVWDWDLRTRSIYFSDRWLSILGLQKAPLHNHPSAWFSLIHPDDRKLFKKQLKEHLTGQRRQFKCEYRLLHKDKTYRWVLTRGTSLWDDQGRPYRLAGSQTDITARKSLENSLYQEKELAQVTLHSIGEAVITTDRKGYVEAINPVAERLTGWSAKEAKHKQILEVCRLIDGTTRKPLCNPSNRAIEEGSTISLSQNSTLISKTGQEFAVSDSASPIRSRNGNIVGTVIVIRDVTEERSRTQRLAWQAAHDPLTHLSNRASFIQSLTNVTHHSKTPQTKHVLCYLDLDHFKAVNDTCGHEAGDQLLKQVADLWRQQIRSSDVLARLGGDEFGLLLYNCDLKQATRIAEDFCNTIQAFRFNYGDKVFNIGVSIGLVAISPEMIGNIQELLSLADSACYTAKMKGRNRVHVHTAKEHCSLMISHNSQWRDRLTLALETDRFCLHRQAIAAASHTILEKQHSEVLLRLRDDSSGQLMAPMGFIPTAERFQLMEQIDRWVLKHALWQLTQSPGNSLYSINLSAASLNDSSFPHFLKQQLAHYGIQPSRLCFEITEVVVIANLNRAASFTRELHQLGCQIALDNFGSGLSALSYLKNLSVNYLKIDGHFIKEAPTDPVTYAMLKAIQQMSRAMQLQTIAKSVESKDVLETVRVLGMDYVQGYEISQPQPFGSCAPVLVAA